MQRQRRETDERDPDDGTTRYLVCVGKCEAGAEDVVGRSTWHQPDTTSAFALMRHDSATHEKAVRQESHWAVRLEQLLQVDQLLALLEL